MEWLKEQATALIAGGIAILVAASAARSGRKNAKDLADAQAKADKEAAEIAAKTARETAQITDRQQSYDQLQEDMKELRKEFSDYKAARSRDIDGLRFQLQYQQKLVRHVDNEYIQLRQAIIDGTVPPIPPRSPWPEETAAP